MSIAWVIIRNKIYTCLAAILLLGFSLPANAQLVSARANLDSALTVIGGQMSFTIMVNQPTGIEVTFPIFADTLTSSIEIVNDLGRDTTFLDNNRLSITQKYTITSFDSGLHYIAPIVIEYIENNSARTTATNSLALNVVNPFAEVDPQKGFFDLKGLFNLPFILSELKRYSEWVLLGLLLAALAYAGWYYVKNRKIPFKEVFVKEKPKELPHLVALRELDKIKSEKLWQSGQSKGYYTRVTDTLRRYMEERFHFQAMEQTTPEILFELEKTGFPDNKLLDKIEQVLNTADLVKFAKYNPLTDENDLTLINAYFFVNQTKEEPILTPDEAVKQSIEREKNDLKSLS